MLPSCIRVFFSYNRSLRNRSYLKSLYLNNNKLYLSIPSTHEICWIIWTKLGWQCFQLLFYRFHYFSLCHLILRRKCISFISRSKHDVFDSMTMLIIVLFIALSAYGRWPWTLIIKNSGDFYRQNICNFYSSVRLSRENV